MTGAEIAGLVVGLFGFLSTALWGLLIWIIKGLHSDVKDLQRAILDLNVMVARMSHCAECANYLPKG